jgi:hypothetical protein
MSYLVCISIRASSQFEPCLFFFYSYSLYILPNFLLYCFWQFFFFFFFFLVVGLGMGLYVCKAGTLLLDLQYVLLWLFWRWGLMNCLPALALNSDPPDLSFPRSQDYSMSYRCLADLGTFWGWCLCVSWITILCMCIVVFSACCLSFNTLHTVFACGHIIK